MKNPKKKIIIGILLIIIGGTVVITNMVFGINRLISNLYEDCYVFPMRLSNQKQKAFCGIFNAKQGELLSFWLKVPDRRIENKDFDLVISLYDDKDNLVKTIPNSFNHGYFRNGSRLGQYYLLGSHQILNEFDGSLKYISSGNWVAPYNGYLVIRKTKPLFAPIQEILLCLLGVFIAWAGINLAQRNKRCFNEIQKTRFY
ncbi:MAG: hypothetical protein HY810_04395 [Candidatus Omnitrophica bacterium]|nr:hypothetical protein [Candidatus Omnitrophota bacterium]